MVTGVSLKGADAALVLLQKRGENYHPIALSIRGNYDRLGSIDGIEEDDNTEAILAFFLAKLTAGEFVVDKEYFEICECYPIEDIEDLLHCFERTMNDHHEAALLGGSPVVFALISSSIWNGIARAVKPSRDPAETLLSKLFKDSPQTTEMYAEKLTDVASHLHELTAVNDLLSKRGIAWRPATDVCQHYTEEIREYLTEAKTKFHDSAVVLKALADYESEVRHLLGEDEEEEE
jgi:hypothetical protein